MPVVPETRGVAGLARERPADASALKALLAPFPSEEITCWPVSSRVGNINNNDPSLIEPMAA
jgi:putative SOS response-associated peptidase YedK